MRSRVLLQWLAGTLGGFLGWCIVEPIPYLTTDPGPGQPPPAESWTAVILFGVITGAAISGCIAAAYGAGSRKKVWRAALIGVVAGAIGGGIGLAIGQFIFATLGEAAHPAMGTVLSPLGYLGLIAARALGWAAVGVGMGVLQGTINGSWQRSRSGAIGGFIGGFIGGSVFGLLDLTVEATTNASGQSPFFFLTGEMMRAISLTVTGSAIGLFVGLTERVLRHAWVRVRVGRNEGTEFMLERAVNSVGRDELSDVPLFGDVSVARHHANISKSGGGFMVEALSPGVAVNGQPVQSAPLHEGDLITVASREIEFHQKGQPRAVPRKDEVRSVAAPPPVPQGICPYCGERKDAQGRCACTPVAPGAPSAPVAAGVPAATRPAAAPLPTAGLAAPAPLRLTGVSGPYAGQVFPLDKPEVTIGREPGRDVALSQDAGVSRRHARIVTGPAGPEILDEGSSNGTFVNGARVDRAPLRPGEDIRIGGTVFRVDAE